jgi:hypothetical protein
MAILPWRTRRQLLYFGIFAAIVIVVIGGLVWYLYPRPTCFDGKQNGGEEGIDCGGPCKRCVGEVQDLKVLWARFFKSKEGFYDVAALIENPNAFAGIPALSYQFKIYDAKNILLAIKEGSVFVNPAEEFVIFETDMKIIGRTPSRAFIEFAEEKNWKRVEKEKTTFSIARRDFINFPFPRLSVEIRNKSLDNLKNVFVTAVLFDEEGGALGVSSTKIDLIPAEASSFAYFTWSAPFEKTPEIIEIFTRINLTSDEAPSFR